MGTWITGLIVAGLAGLALRRMIRDRKNGKSLSCGGDCRQCGGHCCR